MGERLGKYLVFLLRRACAFQEPTRKEPCLTRILSYNVHRCVGGDRRLDVGRVADVIGAQAPDIVALQEIDVGRARTGWVDQAHRLAERLGMAFRFNAALRIEQEQYGDAILTTLPERLVKAASLPGHRRIPGLEARGAIWVAIMIDGVELQVINTHLGLVPAEQWRQTEALTGPDWVGAVARNAPLIVAGDFNAGARTRAYRTMTSRLTESRRLAPKRPTAATFPSAAPMLAIDHLFVSSAIVVDAIATPRDPASRMASDHLPLVMDFHISRA